MPSAQPAAVRDAEGIRAVIDAFLKSARQPALFEPGEELFALGPDNFALEMRGSRLTLQAWDRSRNLTRRIVALESEQSRIAMTVERFAKREGRLFLVDLARPAGADVGRRSARLVFRERFRLLLRRQFPEWTLQELSSETDLEHSLSPVYPRAFLRHGQHGWAAIACPPGADAAGMLSFGLIWLSYLRARERRATIEGLALYAPAGRERALALRLLNAVLKDREAETYQFVVKAVRDDGTSSLENLSDELVRLTDKLHDESRRLAELRAKFEELQEKYETDLRDLSQLRDQLDTVKRFMPMPLVRLARRVFGQH